LNNTQVFPFHMFWEAFHAAVQQSIGCSRYRLLCCNASVQAQPHDITATFPTAPCTSSQVLTNSHWVAGDGIFGWAPAVQVPQWPSSSSEFNHSIKTSKGAVKAIKPEL